MHRILFLLIFSMLILFIYTLVNNTNDIKNDINISIDNIYLHSMLITSFMKI